MATNDTMENYSANLYKENQNSTNMDVQSEDPTVNVAVVVMLSVFSLVGVVGNAIAFYIFLGRRTTSTSVIFILALAGTDFFTCLVTIPWTIAFELLKYQLVYDLACKAYMFIITSTVPFSAYIMVGIALDRYFCICHPFLFAFNVARARAVILCMGIPAVIFGVITAMSYGTYIYADDMSASDVFVDQTTLTPLDQNTSDHTLTFINMTLNQQRIIFYGYCVNNTLIISHDFLEVYKKIHALNFLVAYVSVAVLYILIYKSIFTRRANKARRKKKNLYPSGEEKIRDNQREETQMTIINGKEGTSPKMKNSQTRKDGRSSRKITITARSDTSSAGRSESQRLSSNMPSAAERAEERMTLLEESINSVSAITPSTTASTTAGPATETEDIERDDDDDCGVYIGPRAKLTLKPGLNIRDQNNSGARGEIMVATAVRYTSTDSRVLTKEAADEKELDPKCDDGAVLGNSPDSACPEEKPLLPQSPESPLTPPNSLALKSNLSHFTPPHLDNKYLLPALECKRHSESKHAQSDTIANSLKRKRPSTVRDRNLIANIKTAFMLFIVTLVFLIAFLPALLMANGLIPIKLIVFYGYFIYNVANPFIYAFMNQNFREDLKKIVSVCKR